MSDLISRADAIDAINVSWGLFDVEKEALDMAIEALQNLSKPNNGLQGSDLISRADAIEAVRKELVCDGRHEGFHFERVV